MIGSARNLISFTVLCDGEDCGNVEDLLFDQKDWRVSYLVAAIGSLLTRKKILLSPSLIRKVRWEEECVILKLSQAGLEALPEFEFDLPLMSVGEGSPFRLYKWPFYWTGAGTFGVEGFPSPAEMPHDDHAQPLLKGRRLHNAKNPRYQSAKEICGYRVHATGGFVGHVDDFLFNDETWKMESVLIKSKGWWDIQSAKIKPREVRSISWEKEQVDVKAPREKILKMPIVEEFMV